MKVDVFDIASDTGNISKWSATDRAVSISQAASLDEVSQAVISRLALSKDFPHRNGFPLAVLAAKVAIIYIKYKKFI